jgi:ligand-binding sensor domain-containing protein
MKNLYILIASLLIFGLAQDQTFTNYTTSDGLVDNNVNCVVVDAQDNAWFGTSYGISKFDGTTWTTYTVAMDSGLVNNSIFTICVRANGDVWVGSDFGASKYDGNSWTTYTEADGLGDPRVKIIEENPNGELWFGDYDGLTIFDGSNWTSYTMTDGLPFGGIVSIDFDSNGDAWMGSGLGGLIKFDGTSFTEYTEDEGLLNDIVRSVAVDANDNKWVGTVEGVTRFDENNNFVENHTIMYVLPAPDTLNPTVDVEINSLGCVWAGIYVDYLVTEGGIAFYSGGQWTGFDVSDGLIGPVIRDLEVDSQDDLWVATSTGVSKISDYSGASINEFLINEFNVYPNPVNDRLFIRSKLTIKNVMLFDLCGKLLKNQNITENEVEIMMSEYPKGMYFLRITIDSQTISKKIIVQ